MVHLVSVSGATDTGPPTLWQSYSIGDSGLEEAGEYAFSARVSYIPGPAWPDLYLVPIRSAWHAETHLSIRPRTV